MGQIEIFWEIIQPKRKKKDVFYTEKPNKSNKIIVFFGQNFIYNFDQNLHFLAKIVIFDWNF